MTPEQYERLYSLIQENHKAVGHLTTMCWFVLLALATVIVMIVPMLWVTIKYAQQAREYLEVAKHYAQDTRASADMTRDEIGRAGTKTAQAVGSAAADIKSVLLRQRAGGE